MLCSSAHILIEWKILWYELYFLSNTFLSNVDPSPLPIMLFKQLMMMLMMTMTIIVVMVIWIHVISLYMEIYVLSDNKVSIECLRYFIVNCPPSLTYIFCCSLTNFTLYCYDIYVSLSAWWVNVCIVCVFCKHTQKENLQIMHFILVIHMYVNDI